MSAPVSDAAVEISSPDENVIDIDRLEALFKNAEAKVAVIGLGYVGLPLISLLNNAGFEILGLDIDKNKIEKLKAGQSYIKHIPSEELKKLNDEGRFTPSTDFSKLSEADAIIICVPSPLTKQREPDMSYIENTAREIAKYLKPGQLLSLESTTYPGATREIAIDILEKQTGLKADQDFFIVFSPEREDPGNTEYSLVTVPRQHKLDR